MKLYLSSYRVPTPEDLRALVGKSPADTKLAFIPNAQDYYAERARAFKVGGIAGYFNELGYKPDIVDLRDFDEPEILRQRLAAFDLVWVLGGNTFNLLYEMKRSGFSDIINELVEGGLVYAGESAGAVVAGTDVRGIELADEPGYAEEVTAEGLKLLPHFILPHIDNDEYAEAMATILEQRKMIKALSP